MKKMSLLFCIILLCTIFACVFTLDPETSKTKQNQQEMQKTSLFKSEQKKLDITAGNRGKLQSSAQQWGKKQHFQTSRKIKKIKERLQPQSRELQKLYKLYLEKKQK